MTSLNSPLADKSACIKSAPRACTNPSAPCSTIRRWSVPNRVGSRSNAVILPWRWPRPLTCMRDAMCNVLFPGDAQVSIQIAFDGGDSAIAVIQEERSCKTSAPSSTCLSPCILVPEGRMNRCGRTGSMVKVPGLMDNTLLPVLQLGGLYVKPSDLMRCCLVFSTVVFSKLTRTKRGNLTRSACGSSAPRFRLCASLC